MRHEIDPPAEYLAERELAERARLVAELEVARAFAREFYPRGLIRRGLKAVQCELAAGLLTAEQAAGLAAAMLSGLSST